MKTRNAVLVAAVALFAAQLFAATHTEVTKAPRLPFMRGINFTGWPSGYATDSYATKASTYASLKTMGFDHVRVPIDFRRFTNYDSSTRTATMSLSDLFMADRASREVEEWKSGRVEKWIRCRYALSIAH